MNDEICYPAVVVGKHGEKVTLSLCHSDTGHPLATVMMDDIMVVQTIKLLASTIDKRYKININIHRFGSSL